jgi:hypothetical protein
LSLHGEGEIPADGGAGPPIHGDDPRLMGRGGEAGKVHTARLRQSYAALLTEVNGHGHAPRTPRRPAGKARGAAQ